MSFLDAKYPNLELMEYKSFIHLQEDKEWVEKVKEIKKENRFYNPYFEAEVFPQMWGSTCTAFDICEDGSPAIAGSAMTKAYTVVMHEMLTDTYIIFVDNRICYKVTDATERFYEDLNKRCMAGLSQARELY